MKSKIYMTEATESKKSKAATCRKYYPCKITAMGNTFNALFTPNQIHVALDRANKHPEHMPKSFWSKILFWKKYN